MGKQIKKCEVEMFNSCAIDYKEENLFEDYRDRVDYLLKLLKEKNIPIEGNMLEPGCGTGFFGKKFLKSYPNLRVTGVDISKEMVKLANDGTERYAAILGDLENTNLFPKNRFDIILCAEVLHHFPEIDDVFDNFSRWIKKGGVIIITEPNGSNPIAQTTAFFRRLLGLILGNDFIIKKILTTPNETIHSMEKYVNVLKSRGFSIEFVDTKYFHRNLKKGPFLIKLSCFIKYTALSIGEKILPKRNSGSTLFIIAKKN